MARGKGGKGKGSKKRGGFTTEEFLGHVDKHTSGDGLFFNLKKAGRGIGFIHPVIGIRARKVRGAMLPMRIEKDGDVEVKGKRFNEADPPDADPVTALIEFAGQKIEDGIDGGIVVLNGGKKGKWTLDDLAQNNTESNWKSSLKLKTEYVIPFVKRTEDRDDENPVQLLMAPTSLGKAIQKVIQQEIEDRGSKPGDPMKSPYGFRLTFDKDAEPADMYGAARVDDKLCPLDSETEKILDAEGDDVGIDIDKHVQPGSIDDMKKAIESVWDCREIQHSEFEEFMGDEPASEPVGESSGDEESESVPPKDENLPDCFGEFDGKDEDCTECDLMKPCERKTNGEEEKPAPKRGKRGKRKTEAAKGGKVQCPECKETVKANSKGKCPECLHMLAEDDVPF